MMAVIGSVVFVGAAVMALAAIWASVAPQWRRIVSFAGGQVEPGFHPLAQLAYAERRIAVRRWAMAPAPARRLRAA